VRRAQRRGEHLGSQIGRDLWISRAAREVADDGGLIAVVEVRESVRSRTRRRQQLAVAHFADAHTWLTPLPGFCDRLTKKQPEPPRPAFIT
jgi:hypothetical protein